ncbi:MAG: hypothetical protein ACKPB9_29185, partial [Dolichospermum sp.]
MTVLDNDFDDDLPEVEPELETTEDNEDESPIKRELLTIRLFKEAVKESQGKERDITLEIFA